MKIIRGTAAICTAVERWGTMVAVLDGGRAGERRPEPCTNCGMRRRHRRGCAILDRNVTLLPGGAPEKPRLA